MKNVKYSEFRLKLVKRRAELDEARVLLRDAKAKLAKVQHILRTEQCPHTNCVKVFPTGPRDNGECVYVCAECKRVL